MWPKRSHQLESQSSEEIQPIESQVKTKQELNRQLNESFRNIALGKDKVEYTSRKAEKFEQDRISVQSQISQISFQDELTATLKSRKGETRNALTSDHNFVSEQKNIENAEKNKELTLALLIEHLHRKNFHPRLISKLTEHSKTTADPVHHFLSASKQHLRVSEVSNVWRNIRPNYCKLLSSHFYSFLVIVF